MPKIKIDPDTPITEFFLQHASSLDRGAQVWFHADPFLVWEGGYWYLVTKEDVPDSVLEGLKLDAVI